MKLRVSGQQFTIPQQALESITAYNLFLSELHLPVNNSWSWEISYKIHQDELNANEINVLIQFVNSSPNGESNKNVEPFIFNPKSWLFLGNDNDDSPPNFYDVDENIRYTHELKIAGGIESARFVNLPSEDSLKESLQSLIGRHPLCAYDHDNYYEPFKFIDYNNVSIGNENIKDGTEFSSFDDIKNGNIILYKLETVYENKKGKYLGEKILESRKIKFTVSEILN